jgi:hypothetical protein
MRTFWKGVIQSPCGERSGCAFGAKPVEGLDIISSFFSSPEEVWEWLVTPKCMTDGPAAPIFALRRRFFFSA